MAKADWKSAYLELEGAHLELWRWAEAFAVGLADHAPMASQEMHRRFGTGGYTTHPFSPYQTICAIRRIKLCESEIGERETSCD